jgi:hypothetical protein
MKVLLLFEGGPQIEEIDCTDGVQGATVEVKGRRCPACLEPLRVGGAGSQPSADDRAYEARAFCMSCKRFMGTLRVETDTLFGVREDEAVLNSRYRVF